MALKPEQAAIFAQAGEVLKKYFGGIAAEMETSHNPGRINEDLAVVAVWKPDAAYVRYQVTVDPANGYPYFALHDHRAADFGNKRPGNDTALWRMCHGTSAETARPFEADAANLYYKGHWCTFGGRAWKYVSDTPSAYSPADYAPFWREA